MDGRRRRPKQSKLHIVLGSERHTTRSPHGMKRVRVHLTARFELSVVVSTLRAERQKEYI